MNTETAARFPSIVKMNGSEYRRIGAPVYHIQVQSYRGGFLSTAVTTRERAHVGDFARAQADTLTDWKEARRSCFDDGILTVTDKELICISGYNRGRAAVLSTYRWNPTTGKWAYSNGTRITALETQQD